MKKSIYRLLFISSIIILIPSIMTFAQSSTNKHQKERGITVNKMNQEETMSQIATMKEKPRPEHIAFNVKDPTAVAAWYCDHLGMKIVRKSPPPINTHFISDSLGIVMLELYNNANAPALDFASINHMSLHLAFMVDDVKKIRDSLIVAGARLVEDVTTTPSGDQVLMMRDPWGLAIQFVKRSSPMLTPTSCRPEHIAFNVRNPDSIANWYCKNLGMKIVRKGTPPTNTNFIADAGTTMMMELYHNSAYPLLDLSSIHHLSFHFAFLVDDVKAMRDTLISGGAKLVEDIRVTNVGDQVLMLRDPWGVPIQFIKRAEPMLK